MTGDIPMIHGYEEQHGDERGNDKFDEVTWAELVRLREETRWHVELRITTRCPSCGHQSLFIGKGGHLTCSWLECKEPGLERAIEKLKAQPSPAPDPVAVIVDAQLAELRPQLIEAGHKYADPHSLSATGEEPGR